ncbi:thioesterase family protein [Rhodospirillaceae bacterium SYSU D60014]|uniref:thioesterase family protein n=1 Tax=Virgifigura deserti TaxID=2268457 RepID=UPI000E667514
MRPLLRPGDRHVFSYQVPREKTVPFLYGESPDFRAMPEVFATGFMVGLLEWACLDHLRVCVEPGEGSLGIAIDVTHAAPTVPGMTVTVTAVIEAIDGRRVTWRVEARDEVDLISEGRHQRMIVTWDRFAKKLDGKRAAWAVRPPREKQDS